MSAALLLAAEVIKVLPVMLQLGFNGYQLYLAAKKVIDENRAPDNAEWAALNAKADDAYNRLFKTPEQPA